MNIHYYHLKTSTLGHWITAQHKAYKQGTLTEDQIRLLRQAGFTFFDDDDDSDASFDAAIFYDEHDADADENETDQEFVTQQQLAICRKLMNEAREESRLLAEESRRKDEEIKRLQEEIQHLKSKSSHPIE
jgi:hypothetical protein